MAEEQNTSNNVDERGQNSEEKLEEDVEQKDGNLTLAAENNDQFSDEGKVLLINKRIICCEFEN